jgi:hypothetical protein
MKRIGFSDETFSLLAKNARPRLKTMMVAAIALLTLAFTAPGAHASCGELGGTKASGIKLPMPEGAGSLLGNADDERSNDSIVGLWHVIYTANNAVFAESLKQWHSDGTEFETVSHNPEIGNICLGVWKQVGFRTVRLHHIGWLFSDDGTLTGTFTNDETDTLRADGKSYKGTFVFRTYDVNGTFTGTQINGTIAASRITVS